MFPKKGPSPYGQPPQYGAQQPYGKIPVSVGYAASAAAAGGTDGHQFGGNAAQGAVGQYGGPYAAVYGAQKVGGLASKGPSSSGLPNLQAHQTSLSESSKFSSGAVGSSLGRPNDDYLASRAYVPKLEQYSTHYELERRMYGEQSANFGRRDGFNDLDRRYPDHIPGSHQIHDRVDQVSSTRHQQLLKTPPQPVSDIRQADYFAGRTAGPVHQGSQEVSAYGRVEADHHSLSIAGSVPYGGQQQASILGGTQRTNMDSLVYGQGSSGSGYVMGLPPGRDYASGKSLLHPSSESDYRDSILPRVHPSIPMVDERTRDRVGYRRELDLRDEEHRRGLLWEREKEREWEREQELRNHEMEREQDREREHQRLRERERERGRERERVRLRERRENERERDRKHVAIPRREHTPPRTPGERRRSSSVRPEKPLRRLSPRRDVLHRPRSPVKQLKREYICKVFPFRLVDAERDYLSLTKRYPRLVISPDVSKVVLNWPKGNLNLSMRTPVSLEHDIHEVDDKTNERTVLSSEKSYSTGSPDTVWNVKVLLMSGMSNGAFADICSLRSAEERIAHWNNVLKFAVFKKDHALITIGGPWSAAIDGGDPLIDCSCLVRTAVRCTKELVQIDLSNCTHWNHFLEVHYNRIGKDGLFSHKEITVLFVPNLSECIPSVELWKKTWITYRNSKVDREKLAIKSENAPCDTKEQKEGADDGHMREGDICKDAIKIEKVDTKMDEQGKDGEAKFAENEGKPLDNAVEHNKKGGDVQGNTSGDASVHHAVEDKKPTRRKVIRKVIRKVVREKPTAETSIDKSSQVDKAVVAETTNKTVEEQVEQTTEDVSKEKDGTGINLQPETNRTGKKKVIRRIIKRKVPASGSKLITPAVPAETSKQGGEVKQEKNDESLTDAGNSQIKLAERSKIAAEKISNPKKEEKADKAHLCTEDKKSNGDKVSEQEGVNGDDVNKEGGNGTNDKPKDGKEKKIRDLKKDPKQKSLNDAKEKKKSDEPPKHPGFILQTKKSKESKLRPISLSLDGLLDYTTNDTEESVFELSLFAESFSEMLQFRMGCIILSFLEKLHKHYVTKKNRRKRTREDDLTKEGTKSSEKRSKTTEGAHIESTPNNISAPKNDKITEDDKKKMSIDQIPLPATRDEPVAAEKMEDEDPDYEEDPEEVEIYEDDEDMDGDTAEQQDGNLNSREVKLEEVTKEDKLNQKAGKEIELENVACIDEKPVTIAEKGGLVEVGDKAAVSPKGDSAKHEVVDKDLLQAFRYFDKSRVGYIKAEDLRCIVHNLGKFLSNRDVEDLVEAALDESNSARDNRVIYTKLVKIVDL
ncbi:protein SHORT ROOT IN SALT MEDIUM 1 isoform X3 [Triticum urartu]|uniref:protein SHORT ROOT IN SALT MEDIUM 1 isoform X2 n=1 Tax=Triticum urartu TaxID=4572 RepID=UPI00204473C5|nr:protein SHORT ROOT IN SALT MEDIUM 1 isoform X2 [Triticum urartu]XP_048571276.1 protein SHORT ROOT IN SALT MEDIUM 1 isoform X3 [Triticum urartu]